MTMIPTVEGSSRTRHLYLGFYCAWIVTGLILKGLFEDHVREIIVLAKTDNVKALTDLNYLFAWYLFVPMSCFLAIQSTQFGVMPWRILRAGQFPPPRIAIPFSVRIQRGQRVQLIASAYLLTAVAGVVVIALLFVAWRASFRML